MKLIKKLVFVLMTLCMVLFLKNQTVHAAEGTISFSDPSVTVGNETTVKVNVSTTDSTMLGGVDLTLAYDDSALQFVSGNSASGSSGTVRIAGVIDNATTTSLSYTLTFKTLKAGTSSITVSSHEIISLDYEPISISHVGNSTVTIKEKETVKASSDSKLASLQISPGTLSPAFLPTTKEYSATVGYDTTKIAVSGTPNDSKASVTSVTGTSLSVGSNTVKVVVTAENGTATTYVIKVTRQAQVKQEVKQEESSSTQSPSQTKEDTEKLQEQAVSTSEDSSSQTKDDTQELQEEVKVVEVSIKDVVYRVVSDIPEEIIPKGFKETAYIYKDSEVNILKSDAGDKILFYLEGKDGISLFLYNEEKDIFMKYIPLSFGMSLTVLEFDDSITIPEGFTQASLTINETIITAYQSNQNADLYLIYAQNVAGEKLLYLYDTVDGSVQRYFAVIAEEEKNSTDENSTAITELENQLQELKSSYISKLENKTFIVFALAVLSAILLIIIIILILKIHDAKVHKSMEDDESIDNFNNM